MVHIQTVTETTKLSQQPSEGKQGLCCLTRCRWDVVSQAGGMSWSSSSWWSWSLWTALLPAQWGTAVKVLELLICQVCEKNLAGSLASLNRLPVTLWGSSQDVITQSIYWKLSRHSNAPCGFSSSRVGSHLLQACGSNCHLKGMEAFTLCHLSPQVS